MARVLGVAIRGEAVTGFIKNRPACPRKNTQGTRIWAQGPDGEKIALSTGGRRSPRVPARTWSMGHLVLKTGWLRYNHRLEWKRRAL